ncbi:transposase [Flavobacterium acetivorans]|uniref:transposase n=1 Tax=Flavobacterium acetivorans TaxID=2893883 RepID=UPI003D16737F
MLYKSPNKWSESQKERAAIVFAEYPEIKIVYSLSQKLRKIYNSSIDKAVAIKKLAHWYNDMQNLGIRSFNTIMNTIKSITRDQSQNLGGNVKIN